MSVRCFSLGGEFDHSPLAQVLDLHARGDAATFIVEPAQMLARGAQLFAELGAGDLQAAHRRAVLLGVVCGSGCVLALDLVKHCAVGADLLVQCAPFGIGDRARGILRLDAIVHERIQKELLAHVLEEVLLPPAFEHAVSHFDVTQVPATGHDLSLKTAFAQSRDLPQAKLPVEETYRLIMQVVRHPVPVELRAAAYEAPFVDETALVFAVGQDVEPLPDHAAEQLRTPATAVKDDGHLPSPTVARTWRSKLGKAVIKEALMSAVRTSSGSPARSLIQ